jgi:type 1 glutamine amidotransferase
MPRMLQFVTALIALTCSMVTFGRAEDPAKKVRMLMLTESRGFTHGSVRRPAQKLAPAEIAMTQLGQTTGLFTVDCTQNCKADFTTENLKNYDLVAFYTTGVLPIDDATRDDFLNNWLKQKGHGFIGFHSATDTYRTKKTEHRWYQDLIGGTFNGHPWGAGTTVAITVHDTQHPAMRAFGSEFTFKDEIYQYVNWKPENVHVLMSLNMAKNKTKRPYHVPVAWCKAWGEGKVYYTNLGHNNQTWTNPQFLKSTAGAVRWVMNLAPGDARPNPEISAEQEKRARVDADAK